MTDENTNNPIENEEENNEEQKSKKGKKNEESVPINVAGNSRNVTGFK